jgi:hypothetical protein
MSYESENDRLEKLEETVESLAAFNSNLVSILGIMNKGSRELGLGLFKLVEMVKNENLAAWRYIQSAVVFVDPAERKSFRDILARMESSMELAEHRLNAAVAEIQKIELPPAQTGDVPES